MNPALKIDEEKEGSTFAVLIEEILQIDIHPNAERLELATIKGWQCVVQKGKFRQSDQCVYIPIDSILPIAVEEAIFGKDSKVKLNKSRVKTIKLRGAISQGLVIPVELVLKGKFRTGTDVTSLLGITKYEPPAKEVPGLMGVKREKALENPNFSKYGGIENFKNYPDLFKEDEEVYVTEKIHGTNFRAGYVPTAVNTFMRRIKKFFGKLPAYEFVYGSNNVQLQQKGYKKGFYGENVYGEAVTKYKLNEILKPGEVIYGEVYGAGIQKGYTYGHKEGERSLIIFDLKKDGSYVKPDELIEFCKERSLPIVPEIYRGPFTKETIKALTIGDSVLTPTQKIREGVVVKPTLEEKSIIGRKVLKIISDEYLLGDQTDFH